MRFLMTTDTVGGVWTFTKELAGELLRRGHHIALVSFGGAPSREHLEVTRTLSHKFPHSFEYIASTTPLEWMPDNGSAYSSAESLLVDGCRRIAPDALLLSQFCFGALPLPQPKIVVAHSDVLSWAEAVGKAPLAEDAWISTYRTLVQRGLDGADAVAAPTRSMLDALGRHFNVRCQTALIPNGRSVAVPDQTPARKLQAITAGRLWDQAKNVKMLRDVNSPVPLYVAGESSVTTPPGTNGPCFLGKLGEADLFQRFHSSDLYICTSLYEPFGMAPLEAALCGCAVLANGIPSLREVWGDAALYFHDAASLSALLHHLKNHPGELRAAQVRSSEHAAQYTSARMADHYLALAARLIEQHGSVAHAA